MGYTSPQRISLSKLRHASMMAIGRARFELWVRHPVATRTPRPGRIRRSNPSRRNGELMLSRAEALAWLKIYPKLELHADLQLEFGHEAAVREAERQLEQWSVSGLRFLSLLDTDYPANLRHRPSPPPFLFVRGELPLDHQAVAVIGTRCCSDGGRRRALKLARALAAEGVTVVSGLALGIDTAAHEGALASAGRTVAVVGTGLNTVYPAENRGLHDRILRNDGAVISQFWPDFRGRAGGANFIARNRTMADLSQATVVVEASLRSGARSQAVHVQKSGGKLFLLRSLVKAEKWASEMTEKPGCHVVDGIEDVLSRLQQSVGHPLEGSP